MEKGSVTACLRMTWPQYQRGECWWRGARIHLTRTEAEILGYLLMAYPRLVRRDELVEAIYPQPDYEPDSAAAGIRVHVYNMHRKFREDVILNERGRGYYINGDWL